MSRAPHRLRERAVRALALVALYMLDARGEADESDVRAWVQGAQSLALEEEAPAPASASRSAEARWEQVSRAVAELTSEERERAMGLALEAHRHRRSADARAAAHAPQWPAARQPAMDRAVLRLALRELEAGRVDPRIVINEAVELAKRYCGERSSGFINAILDRAARAAGLVEGEAAAVDAHEPPQAPVEEPS